VLIPERYEGTYHARIVPESLLLLQEHSCSSTPSVKLGGGEVVTIRYFHRKAALSLNAQDPPRTYNPTNCLFVRDGG
jgi:hypothetical protein